MAATPLKVLSYAQKDVGLDEFNQLCNQCDVEDPNFRKELERELTYIGTFGLENPEIHNIKNTVDLIKWGRALEEHDDDPDKEVIIDEKPQVEIRMISGDHIDTCKKVAVDTGILFENEAEEYGVCVTGEEFRKMIGNV